MSRKIILRHDLTFTPDGAQLVIHESKTIQFKQCQLSITLPLINNSDLCPIAALHNNIKLNCVSSHQPLFSVFSAQTGASTPITDSQSNAFIKRVLRLLGEDPRYFSPHSFRRGGATFAFDCGLPAESIKMQGDWLSDAYLVYLELTEVQKCRAARSMAHKIQSMFS